MIIMIIIIIIIIIIMIIIMIMIVVVVVEGSLVSSMRETGPEGHYTVGH